MGTVRFLVLNIRTALAVGEEVGDVVISDVVVGDVVVSDVLVGDVVVDDVDVDDVVVGDVVFGCAEVVTSWQTGLSQPIQPTGQNDSQGQSEKFIYQSEIVKIRMMNSGNWGIF